VNRIYHDIPVIHIDESQMEQVFFNLYMNALQAMPDGGTLTITCQVICTGSAHSTQSQKRDGGLPIAIGIPIGASTAQQHWLEVSVSDTGVGLAPEQLERLFQPFFTTKAHGIGLGLPITRRLVEDHRGYLLVESQPGYGATFSVRLPIAGTGHTESRIGDNS
jgi:signal transduction histidine kinase